MWRQGFRDFELILVLDGADAATRAEAERQNDPRLRLLRQANDGLSSARNRGLGAARGDYVCFLDADDTRPPWALQSLARAIDTSAPDLILAPGILSEERQGSCHGFTTRPRWRRLAGSWPARRAAKARRITATLRHWPCWRAAIGQQVPAPGPAADGGSRLSQRAFLRGPLLPRALGRGRRTPGPLSAAYLHLSSPPRRAADHRGTRCAAFRHPRGDPPAAGPLRTAAGSARSALPRGPAAVGGETGRLVRKHAVASPPGRLPRRVHRRDGPVRPGGGGTCRTTCPRRSTPSPRRAAGCRRYWAIPDWPPPRSERFPMPPTPSVFHAFGQSAALEIPADGFTADDNRWRLREIHEPALAQWTLPVTGHAVDVGAGFGAFALLFALGPSRLAGHLLRARAERLRDARAQYRGAEPWRSGQGRASGDPSGPGGPRHVAPRPQAPGVPQRGCAAMQRGTRAEPFPARSAESLPDLAPTLLKLIAPGPRTCDPRRLRHHLAPLRAGRMLGRSPSLHAGGAGQGAGPHAAGRQLLAAAGRDGLGPSRGPRHHRRHVQFRRDHRRMCRQPAAGCPPGSAYLGG